MLKLRIFSNIKYLHKAKGEDALTNQVAIALTGYSLENKLKGIWFHVPNESVVSEKNKLTDIIRIKRKQCMGLINGAPDLIFIKDGKALFIELKTKKGHLSDAQKDFQSWCNSENIGYHIARSVDDTLQILKDNDFLVLS